MESKKIEKLIKKSLIELAKITNEKDKDKEKKQKSKLIFPKYLNGKHRDEKRVSEQEARILFIRKLEKEKDNLYYSIETPTTDLYKFSDKDYKKNDHNNEKYKPEKGKGQSASFDLTIYNDKFERVHFVEFKNENVDTVKKDFLKLLCDEKEKENYFVHIIERRNLRKGKTLESIMDKYQNAIKYIHKEYQITSSLKIILFNIKDGEQIWFEKISENNRTIKELKKQSLCPNLA